MHDCLVLKLEKMKQTCYQIFKLTPNWILVADSVYYPLTQCQWWPDQYKAISSGYVGKLAKQEGSNVARIQVEVELDSFRGPLIKLGYI